ncbi:hypothetical protein [Methanoculleus sp.]|uniref:InlB B-repeat-containing protein n=1 Tax=Methanoculleus sp. TaxID=90427 RepID=UPI001BD6A0CC|nr:hypothetical protein [Methanoculleus sp.]
MKSTSLVRLAGLMFVVLILVSAAPAAANDTGASKAVGRGGGNVDCPADNGNGHAYGAWEHNWKCQCAIPPAFSEVENLTIDTAIIESTPHWIFLAAGTEEKDALLDYIDGANVPDKQKNEWTQFVRKMWKEYPVVFDNSTGNPALVPGRSSDEFTLTPAENATFQEIERYIAEDMEAVRAGEITIRWYQQPTHMQFMETALNSEIKDLSDILINTAKDAAWVPDTWCNDQVCQSWNHGFIPTSIALPNIAGIPVLIVPPQIDGIGDAPGNFGQYATLAKQRFDSHDYSGAFTNMGYASHFITDLGNPYHTPMAQIIPLEQVNTPYSQIVFPNFQMILDYKTLHHEYEGMVADHWDTFYTGDQGRYDISNPTYSAKIHGTYSWAMSYPLIYNCYWHFVINGDFDFEENPAIVAMTQNRIGESMKYTRGLVEYVTGGQYPMLTVTATAGPGGSISPSGAVPVRYGESQSFTIRPDSGYVIDKILVDNVAVTRNPYTFSSVTADHTIEATFKELTGSGKEWIWSRDGWDGWSHEATWSGTEVGPCSEYGPVIVDGHGEHGINVNLIRGSTTACVEKQFTDASGNGWNTLTFVGLMTASDTLGGRWMTIEVNGQQVFAGTALQVPPGDDQMFEISVPFPQSDEVNVKISHGQNPAWNPRFAMHFYSLELSRNAGLMTSEVKTTEFVVPDGSIIVGNETVPTPGTMSTPEVTETDSP